MDAGRWSVLHGARGPMLLLAAIVLGIVLGERAGGATAGWLLGTAALLGVGALTRRGRVGLALGAVALALFGTASMQRALHGLDESPLRADVEAYRSRPMTVTLAEDPSGPTRFVVDALGRTEGRTVLVVGRGDAAGRLRILSAGDRVQLRGSFRPLAGYDTRQRWRHAVGAYEATEVIALQDPSAPLVVLANRMRGWVLAGTGLAPATERALLAGLLLGDTRGIPPRTVEEFRAAGLTHHLAVSGENVAFVLALAGPVLRRFGSRGRFIGGVAVLVLFGAMTRWEPSVLRAIAMAGAVMLAVSLGRPAAGLRVLVLAAGGLLLADPFLLHSVGFLLSCGATAGIALLAAPIAARLPGPAAVREPLAVTAAAQIGVAPVMIPVFGSVPLAALPANLLAAPLMAPITIGGLVAGTVGGFLHPSSPALAAAVLAPVVTLVRALEGIASAGARVELGVDARGAVALVVACSVVGGVLAGRSFLTRPLRRPAGRLAGVEERSTTTGNTTKRIA